MFPANMKPFVVQASEKAIQYATPAQDASFVDKINASIRGRMFLLVTCPAAIVDSIDFFGRSIITLAFANQYTGKIFDRFSSVKHTELNYETAKLGFKQAAILFVSAIALPILGIIALESTQQYLTGFGFAPHPLLEDDETSGEQLNQANEDADIVRQFETTKQNLERVTGERDTAQGNVTNLQRELEKAQKASADLQTDLDTASAKATRIKAELEKAQKASANLQTDLNAANAKATRIEAELEEAQKASASLQTDLNAANAKAANLQTQLDAANEKAEKFEGELEEALRELANLRDELNTANAEIADLKGKFETPGEPAKLQEKLESTEEELNRLSLAHGEEIIEKEHAISKLEKKVSILETELQPRAKPAKFSEIMTTIKTELEKMDEEFHEHNKPEQTGTA